MKYFGVPPESLSFGAVYGLQKQTNIEIDKRQKNTQPERPRSWKARMKNITQKSDWLNRKSFMSSPSLVDDSSFAWDWP